ncbi:hypothetical protein KVR01_006914 [Diaporthe batatas]|uniref:uncharacterized protein n=1 Tax=Diaporthe batatas TaxID=748121 RepID=UPI001D038924|nr:uncharacterized protein KVR01_006914 [Diaporthe batatas]KAG8163617.1 hypothetical protein KVR01_006914 [Diaporthe batatas]
MASAAHPRISTRSLNGRVGGNGTTKRVADDDDDSLVTEQFPAFDPAHDGSEDDLASSSHNYTHQQPSALTDGATMDGINDGFDDGQEDSSYHHAGNSPDAADLPPTPLSNVDPVPEPDHQSHQRQKSAPETSIVTSPAVTSPPYWAHGHTTNGTGGASRANHGNQSTESLVPGAITLQDNEADDDDGEPSDRQRNSEETRTSYGRDRNRACWAKSVEVTNYVVVNSSATNIGAFVVWNIRVQTLSGPFMNIRKRYSEFDDFRHQLISTFPNFEAAVPTLPPKSVISRFRPKFLEKRRAGLQYFLNCILLNPEFSGSPVLKDFLFA